MDAMRVIVGRKVPGLGPTQQSKPTDEARMGTPLLERAESTPVNPSSVITATASAGAIARVPTASGASNVPTINTSAPVTANAGASNGGGVYNILQDPKAKAIHDVMKHLNDWDFDIFSLSDHCAIHPLMYVGYAVLHHFELPRTFKIPERILFNFLSGIEYGYNWQQNPYHNSIHAADVLQTAFVLLKAMQYHMSTDLDLLALFVAAIIHVCGVLPSSL